MTPGPRMRRKGSGGREPPGGPRGRGLLDDGHDT